MDQRMLAKKTNNLTQRLDDLEKSMVAFTTAVNDGFQRIDNQLGNQVGGLTQVMDAIVTILGLENVQKTLVELQMEKEKARIEAEKAKGEADARALAEGVANGTFRVANVVTDKCTVVGTETTPDGNAVGSGRIQFEFNRVGEPIQKGLVGQAVGYVLDLSNGNKFEVKEIYEATGLQVTAPTEVPVASMAEAAQPTTEATAG